MTSTMEMARAEREEFAALLEELTPQQWDGPTLCEKWRVRDVVANQFHVKKMSSVSRVLPLTGGLLCQTTFGLSFIVNCKLSGDHSHDSASSGPIFPTSAGSRWPGTTPTSVL